MALDPGSYDNPHIAGKGGLPLAERCAVTSRKRDSYAISVALLSIGGSVDSRTSFCLFSVFVFRVRLCLCVFVFVCVFSLFSFSSFDPRFCCCFFDCLSSCGQFVLSGKSLFWFPMIFFADTHTHASHHLGMGIIIG